MERYTQYRDRGSGISPFLPVHTTISWPAWGLHVFIFLFRFPIFLFYTVAYFLLLNYVPFPVVVHKLLLGGMLAIPGIWWIDLQLDGVKRGSLHQQPSRVPQPGSIIAAQFTSPIDALYLAAIFNPIFTISYPGSRKVQRISLLGAILLALTPVKLISSSAQNLTSLRKILEDNPNRVIAVFPECGTTNGKGLLPLSPSLLSAPAGAKIFPISIRYTPADITTPIPLAYFHFLWTLLSTPSHAIRVRIGEAIKNSAAAGSSTSDVEATEMEEGEEPITAEGKHILDYVAETLARLARNKRVGLTLSDKAAFVRAWKAARK